MRILLLHHCRWEGGKFKPMRRTPGKFPRKSGRSIIQKKHHNRQKHGLESVTFFLSAHKSRMCFFMNNRHSLLFNPVTVVESIRTTKRCRVCGSLLVATGKRKRPSYKCTEFSERVNSIFSIAFTNLYCCEFVQTGDEQSYTILQLHKSIPMEDT